MPSTILRPTNLTSSSRQISSAPSRFQSSIVQLSTFHPDSTTIVVTQLFTCSSLSPTAISTSSTVSSDSTSTTSHATTDFQPSVVPSDPPASTVCNQPPPTGYIDVNPADVGRYADEFCKTEFTQDCPTTGFAFQYSSNFANQVVGYNMTINPLLHCSGLSTSTCEYPLSKPEYDCAYSLKAAWQNCE